MGTVTPYRWSARVFVRAWEAGVADSRVGTAAEVSVDELVG